MEDFETALINLINANQLPFEAKRYVVLKVARDVEDTYQAEKAKRLKELAERDENGATSEDR